MAAETASQSQVFKSYRGGCGIASRRGIAVPTATGYRGIGSQLIVRKRCGGRGLQTAGIRTSLGNQVVRRIRGPSKSKKPAGVHPQVFLKDSRTVIQQDSENRTSQQPSGITIGRIYGATTASQSKFEVLILLLPSCFLRWKQTGSHRSQFFVGGNRDNRGVWGSRCRRNTMPIGLVTRDG
jgi:hypothetical protein